MNTQTFTHTAAALVARNDRRAWLRHLVALLGLHGRRVGV